jgi:hypothetical protein
VRWLACFIVDHDGGHSPAARRACSYDAVSIPNPRCRIWSNTSFTSGEQALMLEEDNNVCGSEAREPEASRFPPQRPIARQNMIDGMSARHRKDLAVAHGAGKCKPLHVLRIRIDHRDPAPNRLRQFQNTVSALPLLDHFVPHGRGNVQRSVHRDKAIKDTALR